MRCAVIVALVVLPVTAVAQRITITPRVGAYVPLADQGGLTVIYECDPVACGGGETFGLQPGVTAGLTVAVQWDAPLGIEAAIGTASLRRRHESTFWIYPATSDPDPEIAYTPTRTTSAALRIRFAGALGERADLALGAGLSLTYLSGEGYDVHGPRDRSTVGPSFAATLGVDLRPGARFEAGVEYRYHPFQPAHGQRDLVVAAGVGLVLRP